jgi:hypothetical protein
MHRRSTTKYAIPSTKHADARRHALPSISPTRRSWLATSGNAIPSSTRHAVSSSGHAWNATTELSISSSERRPTTQYELWAAATYESRTTPGTLRISWISELNCGKNLYIKLKGIAWRFGATEWHSGKILLSQKNLRLELGIIIPLVWNSTRIRKQVLRLFHYLLFHVVLKMF